MTTSSSNNASRFSPRNVHPSLLCPFFDCFPTPVSRRESKECKIISFHHIPTLFPCHNNNVSLPLSTLIPESHRVTIRSHVFFSLISVHLSYYQFAPHSLKVYSAKHFQLLDENRNSPKNEKKSVLACYNILIQAENQAAREKGSKQTFHFIMETYRHSKKRAAQRVFISFGLSSSSSSFFSSSPAFSQPNTLFVCGPSLI